MDTHRVMMDLLDQSVTLASLELRALGEMLVLMVTLVIVDPRESPEQKETLVTLERM